VTGTGFVLEVEFTTFDASVEDVEATTLGSALEALAPTCEEFFPPQASSPVSMTNAATDMHPGKNRDCREKIVRIDLLKPKETTPYHELRRFCMKSKTN
jgi:hypothetical protein